jgi:hypothetical protein
LDPVPGPKFPAKGAPALKLNLSGFYAITQIE